MSDKPSLPEELHQQENYSSESPFSFLEASSKASVDFVHMTVLSKITATAKNDVILAFFKDANEKHKYKQWRMQVMKRAPNDCFLQLCDQDQRDIENWFQVLFEEAKQILQNWNRANDHPLEKRKGTEQNAKVEPKRLRRENDNAYPPEMENVSALQNHSAQVTQPNVRPSPSGSQPAVSRDNYNKNYDGVMKQSERESLTSEEQLHRYETEKKSITISHMQQNDQGVKAQCQCSSHEHHYSPQKTHQAPIHYPKLDNSPYTSTYSNDYSSVNHTSRLVNNTPPGPRTRSKSAVRQTQIENAGEVPLSDELEDLGIDLTTTKPLYILLLGETGVGKTTAINSLANYLKYKTLDEVLAGEPTILVDTSFTTTNSKHKMVTVEAKANTGKNQNKRNEVLGSTGNSSTQDPMNHVIRWNENGVERVVVLIDTPGINDTRGEKQDEKNFDKILSHISKIGQLHAICILMKPNESKFTVGFRYCIDNLLVKLHKSATQNILFCFTNTRSTLYRPGDTLSTLHEYLKKLAKDTGVRIKADRTNIFCFDNDCFRYMCILRKFTSAATPSSMATFSQGWTHNVEESAKMLTRVEGLSAHIVEDTVNINKTRRLVTALARPLAEIARNHVLNMKLIEERIVEIENLKRQGKEIGSHIHKEQVVMELQHLEHPRTVCSSPQCNHFVKINELETQMTPLKICHDDCHLRDIPEQSVNNPDLAYCKAFKADFCTVCGCHWKRHMHISYQLVPRLEMVTDINAQGRFDYFSDRKQNAESFLKEEKEKLKMLENEHDQIRECCAEFAAFLSSNCMKQTADPFIEYLQHLIDEEEVKSANGGSSVMLCELANIYDDYQQRVKQIMKEIEDGHRSALTSSQLDNHIKSLCRLKHCGPTIAQLKDIQYVQSAEIPDDHIKAAIDQNCQDLTNDLRNMRLNAAQASSHEKRHISHF